MLVGRESGLERRVVDAAEYPGINLLLRGGVLCNDAKLVDGKVVGDPTEGALLVLPMLSLLLQVLQAGP